MGKAVRQGYGREAKGLHSTGQRIPGGFSFSLTMGDYWHTYSPGSASPIFVIY